MNRVNREKHLSPSRENVFAKPNLGPFGTSFLSADVESKFLRISEASVPLMASQQQVKCPPCRLCLGYPAQDTG